MALRTNTCGGGPEGIRTPALLNAIRAGTLACEAPQLATVLSAPPSVAGRLTNRLSDRLSRLKLS